VVTRLTPSVMRSLIAVVVTAVLTGCATAALTPMNRLGELKPGVSTKIDVERILGPRHGEGGASFPAGTRPATARYEIWYYVDYQKKEVTSDVKAILPRMLLVFFDRDVFHGFMWFDLIGAKPRR
jgi:hypothetical protein